MPQSLNERPLQVAIVGGGLVGSLAALSLAQMGHDVHLYEYREDIRTVALAQGRSINLALSYRGRKALRQVGLEEEVLATAIPMRGRMLHDIKGRTSVVLYDPCTQQCLYSVGRKHLNEVLLNAGEKYTNISRHFEHKLIGVDLKAGAMQFQNPYTKATSDATAELIIGCDGAFSAVRQAMVRLPGFQYSQEYIEHGYLELCIPAKDGEFQMPANYLHIWPRDRFMMIALPNQDKSFTVTLSMPFSIFAGIRNPDELLQFFGKYYADAVPLIGERQLVHDFFKAKPQYLVSVKCKPYHLSAGALLMGDAAHAMVPYYGQGMNAGMEDVTLLTQIMQQGADVPLADVLQQFTDTRWRDAHAICDLAMYNYVEMRDLTKRFSFRCRKWLDTLLFRYAPTFWLPLYNSVSFSDMPYSQCIANKSWQDQFLRNFVIGSGLLALLSAGATFTYLTQLSTSQP